MRRALSRTANSGFVTDASSGMMAHMATIPSYALDNLLASAAQDGAREQHHTRTKAAEADRFEQHVAAFYPYPRNDAQPASKGLNTESDQRLRPMSGSAGLQRRRQGRGD